MRAWGSAEPVDVPPGTTTAVMSTSTSSCWPGFLLVQEAESPERNLTCSICDGFWREKS